MMKLLTAAIVLAILSVTLFITYLTAHEIHATSDSYAADGDVSARTKGSELAGDWISAAAILGFSELISPYGIDSSPDALAALTALLVVLMVIAEPVRYTGRFTFGDAIVKRMKSPSARFAAILGTLVVNVAYMALQMPGEGALATLSLGVPYDVAVVLLGVVLIVFVLFGGVIATMQVQIVDAILLLVAASVLVLMLLVAVHLCPVCSLRWSDLFRAPAQHIIVVPVVRSRHHRPGASHDDGLCPNTPCMQTGDSGSECPLFRHRDTVAREERLPLSHSRFVYPSCGSDHDSYRGIGEDHDLECKGGRFGRGRIRIIRCGNIDFVICASQRHVRTYQYRPALSGR
jgi:hypothetical protein